MYLFRVDRYSTDTHLTTSARSDKLFVGINASVVVMKWDDMKRQGQVNPSMGDRLGSALE